MVTKATLSNYRDARLALPRLQYTSDVERNDGGKRKVTKPTRYEPECNRQPPCPPSTFPGPSMASHEESQSDDSEVFSQLHSETPKGHGTGESFGTGDTEFATAGTAQLQKKN